MRVTLVIHSLAAGGSERVVSLLAHDWTERGHAATVITLTPQSEDFFPLPAEVTRVTLDVLPRPRDQHRLTRAFRRISHLRRAIVQSSPDVVVSFLSTMNLITLLAARPLDIPVVISERTDPRMAKIDLRQDFLRRLLYRRELALVVQTDAVACWARGVIPPERVVVIPNPVAAPPRGSRRPSPRPEIVAVGRLGNEKGFDLLIDAFAACAGSQQDWRLTICGEGDERAALEARVRRYGLQERIAMPGTVADVYPVLERASLFVLSSRFEGFPNALLEAMACGLPVISTDCPSGPRRIVRHEIDGLLVPAEDPGALAAAMDRFMSDPEARRRLSHGAPEVLDRFSLRAIGQRWDVLLRAIAAEPSA